jgi:hypothetical protein
MKALNPRVQAQKGKNPRLEKGKKLFPVAAAPVPVFLSPFYENDMGLPVGKIHDAP